MGYKIDFENQAKKEFSKLDQQAKKQIQKYIDKLAERDDPRSLGDPLESNLVSFWRYRVGDYRLVAEILDDRLIVLFVVVAHRKNVYDIAKKRLT